MLRMLSTPRWIGLTAAALALVAAFGALSWWQWQRAQRDRVEAPAVAAATVFSADQPLADSAYGTRVEVAGVYDAEHQVLVEHGPASFWVVTPIRPASGTAIAVTRGTVTSVEDPAVAAVPTGVVTVIGVAQPFEGDPGTGTTQSGVAERITASAFDPTYPLALGWIALEAQVPPTVGLGGVTPPIGIGTTSSIRLQNAMYAVQWICFAAFVLFFWVRMLRDDLRGAAPTPTPSTPVREVY